MRSVMRLGVLGVVLAVAPAAHADVVSGYVQLEGGFAGGKGISGARKDDSFHAGSRGPAYGLVVGAEVLFIDVWIQHDQYRGKDGLSGTWTQFMTGFDVEVDLGSPKGGTRDAKGNVSGTYSSAFAEIGTGFGFGVGTGQQIDPPLDNSEVTDKGFLLQGLVAGGYRINRLLSIGVSVPVQAAYLIKSGVGEVANDNNGYFEFNVALMATLRFKLQLK